MSFGPQTLPFVNENPKVTWKGASGISYDFWLHPIGTIYLAIPGAYIFCKPASVSSWNSLYVGETDNFLRRLTNELAAHHRWNGIRAHGATHICTLVIQGGNAERLRIETDLRHGLNPPCNRQ